MQDVADFHTFLLWVIAVICAVVLGLLLTCIVRFNTRANPTPSRTTHKRVINRRRNNRARKNPNFARAATASCHGMTPPVWRVLSRGAMSLAGLAAIREFPVPPNHKSRTAAMHS
jgi:heme/copper-type cytochrome/quinol oxidase subunit 2